ncbi:NAD-dependent epimerase/dehydratase family protein [Tolumonas osonensis]|uniref:Nucleoside-diphosphate-sugar epimerase n=1 Tax=Tolumonas osonensis TaxID=675874 RepID=A0A841GRD5_9GAMM|nr:NAD-dependent epimerase/dehydratase family protein [Tolumonas osonensis]MBB6056213.1 nucleoside-diphosphate-sugar epimerase [Tolumonas osonensis]
MAIESKKRIFITGGTGYIGGSFLHLMWERNYLENFDIRVLVRNIRTAEKLSQLGFTAVIGSLDDAKLLAYEAESADIIFNTANCDHVESAIALLHGAMNRYSTTSVKPIFIHTSGAGVLTAHSLGCGVAPDQDLKQDLWDEADVEKHVNISSHAPHRFVDIEIFKAAEKDFVKTYLVVPPTVFGVGLGPFASSRMSIQIPRLVYSALMRRQTMKVGAGNNIWPNVHVADLAELYLVILDAALQDKAPSGLQGLFYPVSEHFCWGDVSMKIAELLYQKKLLPSAIVTSGLQPGWFWGSNVIVRSTNSMNLGWQVKNGGTNEMLRDIEHDISLVLEAVRSNNV